VGGIDARGAIDGAVGEEPWLQAMLDVEVALGGEPLQAHDLGVSELGREAAEHASPVVPPARRFPDRHTGATSQDILDPDLGASSLLVDRALEAHRR